MEELMVHLKEYQGKSATADHYNRHGQRIVSAALDTVEILRVESIRIRRGVSMAQLIREALRELKD